MFEVSPHAVSPAVANARGRFGADVIADAVEARRDELISTGMNEIQDRMDTYRGDTALIEDVTRGGWGRRRPRWAGWDRAAASW